MVARRSPALSYGRVLSALGTVAVGCDLWMDAAFPIAIAFLCVDARYPAYALLLLWLVWRLVLKVGSQPVMVVFLLLLGALAGQFVLERDLQPSSVSDPLVIAMGFVSMIGRQDWQWRNTLRWVSLCMIPLLIWSFSQDPLQALDLPVGGINRLGFLLGLLQLTCWGSVWMAGLWLTRCFFAGLAIGSVPLLIHNGSRVGLFAPPIAMLVTLVIALACRPLWLPSFMKGLLVSRKRILSFIIVLWVVIGGVVLNHWYHGAESQINLLSDRGRVETALCWARQPFRGDGKRLVFGLGHNLAVQRRCDVRQVPSMQVMNRPEGLPHAHNLFAQVLAENGLFGALSLSVLLALLARRALSAESLTQTDVTRRFFFAIPFLVFLLINAFVSSFQIFMMTNQLLISLGLASLWPRGMLAPSHSSHDL